MPAYGCCWYSELLRYWYSAVLNTETEEALSKYEQDAQLTRAAFNESGGRLLARCHTGNGWNLPDRFYTKFKRFKYFFWIVSLSCVLSIHCSLSIHSSSRFTVLQLFHSLCFLPLKSRLSSCLSPLPHPSAWDFPCPGHALQRISDKCPVCWIRMVIMQDWVIQPLCYPFHFSYEF